MKFTFTTTSLASLFALSILSLAAPTEVSSTIEKRTTWPVGLTTDVNYLVWCLQTNGKQNSAVYTYYDFATSPLFAGPSAPDVNTVISTTIAEDFIDGGVFWTPATETSSFVMVVSIDSEAITGNASEVGIGKNTAWFGPQLCYYIEGELVVYMPKTTETCVTQFYCVNGPPSTLGINENDKKL